MLKDVFLDGIWRRNVASVQLLGLCPLLAVSYSVSNAIGLAIASSFVLVFSSISVSSIRKYIPSNIRLPCFVLVIATLTTVVMLFMQAFTWDLYMRVALFIQIIVTNCMILGQIESVASKQNLYTSFTSAVATALGFSLALLLLGGIRQGLGEFSTLAIGPVGAFLVAGITLAILNYIVAIVRERIPN